MVALDAATLLEGILARTRPRGWQAQRSRAEAALDGQRLPTTRQEAWTYTDLAPLRDLDFAPGEASYSALARYGSRAAARQLSTNT